jgi:hypothetical protein
MTEYIVILLGVLLLITLLNKFNKTDQFTSSSDYDKKNKIKIDELYKNKYIFKPGLKYGSAKKIMPWIDPVIYDDLYKESLNNDLSISYIEKIIK